MMSSWSTQSKAKVIHVAKEIYTKSGFKAFYRGLPAGLLGVFPYSGKFYICISINNSCLIVTISH